MLPLLPGGSNGTHSLPSGQLPFAPNFLLLASVSLASWEGQGPEEKGLSDCPPAPAQLGVHLHPSMSLPSAGPLARCPSPFHTKAKSGLRRERRGCHLWLRGSSALLDTSRFWHPAIGQSALERNYLDGLKNNQRKGARTMALCPLLAQLPLPRRQSRDVQSSCQLGQAGPFASQPPGASFWWGSLQLSGSFWELAMHALWTKT